MSDDELFRIDLTAVKTSDCNHSKKNYECYLSFLESNILKNEETYEFEIEYIGSNEKKDIQTNETVVAIDDFISKFSKKFDLKPNHLSLLSYDLIGLIYYLSLTYDSQDISKSFKTKNTFKGKIGIFEIKDNRINHQLNFYQINNGKLKEIF